MGPGVVVSPAAQKYLQGAVERGKGLAPKLGSQAPPVQMPRLDLPAPEGVTMSDAARMQRQVPAGVILGDLGGERPRVPPPQASPPSHAGIQAGDMLPEPAMNDPRFRGGLNSGYAVHQDPSLAYQYGVIRNGAYVPGKALKGENVGQLSSATASQLQGILAAQGGTTPEGVQQQQEEAELAEAAKQGPGGAVGARAAEHEERLLGQIDNALYTGKIDALDYDRLRESLIKNMLRNDEQRTIVEARLTPMRLSELIATNRMRQNIPVIPGEFEFMLTTYDVHTELEVKKLLFQERAADGHPELTATNRYYLDKYVLMLTTIGLYSINDTIYGDAVTPTGEFDVKLFTEKFKRVSRLPFQILLSVMVHYEWFDIRVRRMLKVTELKNS